MYGEGVVIFVGGFMRGLGGRVGYVFVYVVKVVFVVVSVVVFLVFIEYNYR